MGSVTGKALGMLSFPLPLIVYGVYRVCRAYRAFRAYRALCVV